MVGWSGAISFVVGLFLGVLITVTKPGNILEHPLFYQIIDKVVNLFRSVPFIILLACLVPISRLIMGTAIGVKGAIVPLVFGCAPFFTRQIESALADVDPGLIEAAQSMGLDNKDIIFRVYLKESIAGIARGTTITIISLIGLQPWPEPSAQAVWATLPLCMVIRETCRISLIQQWLCWLSLLRWYSSSAII